MTETFDITREQAEAYEELFVPALFAQWAPLMIDIAHIEDGQRVLDVACGTGVVARAAADRVGRSGSVVGLDLNPAMLEVAAGTRRDIEWRQGDAANLPFEDSSSMPCCANLRCFSFRTLTPQLPKWHESYGPVGASLFRRMPASTISPASSSWTPWSAGSLLRTPCSYWTPTGPRVTSPSCAKRCQRLGWTLWKAGRRSGRRCIAPSRI